MPGAGAVHHIKAGLEFPRLALFRLTRREKVVEPPKDRSADGAIHQRSRPVFFDLRDAFSFGDRDWLGSHAAISTFYLMLVLLLFSYGPDAMDQFQHAAGCVDRIDSESYSAVVLYCERCRDLGSALPKSRGRKPKKLVLQLREHQRN